MSTKISKIIVKLTGLYGLVMMKLSKKKLIVITLKMTKIVLKTRITERSYDYDAMIITVIMTQRRKVEVQQWT